MEIQKELNDVLTTKPITETEFTKDKENQVLQLPGSWETMRAVNGSLGELITYNLPDDYFKKYPSMVESLQLSQVQDAAKKMIHPDNLVWVVVGDRSKIEDGIKSLGFDEVHFLDADGNVMN